MKDWLPVFKLARKSLLILAGVLIFSLFLYFGSAHLQKQLSADLASQQAQIAAEEENLGQKQKDLDNILSHIQQFQKLQQKGLIGAARREGWVEQLIASRKQLGLPDTLAYTLKQPTPLREGAAPEDAAAATTPTPSNAPLAHNLEFELRNIHEEEFLSLLKTYEGKVLGRFRVQSCRITEPSPTGLTAQCTLRFFTMPQKPAGQT
ncbi:MAG: hypothetical protein H6R18_1329 [Proteobacteria bacterium]|nr:hypothetical protein [Pseudomonadota bacterium]